MTWSYGQQIPPIPGGCLRVGPNLVENPDFDNGNVGFASDYNYNSAGLICDWGQYTIASSVVVDPDSVCFNAPGFALTSIWSVTDRNNPGVGQFMIIDPSNATGIDDDVWRQDIPICSNETYTFSVWAKNIYFSEAPNYSGVDPEFEMTINGIPVTGYFVNGVLQPNSTFTLPRQPQADSAVWFQISGSWSAGNTNNAQVVIRNTVTGSQGNDLAIDGVFFSLCGQSVDIAGPDTITQCGNQIGPVTFQIDTATINSGWAYYEWWKNGTAITGSTSPISFTTPVNPNNGAYFGIYELVVYRNLTNGIGSGCSFRSDPVYVLPSPGCPFTIDFPVEWLDFTARSEGNDVLLNWATASELNNMGFEIEMSGPEQEAFQKVGFVRGFGNSSTPKHYAHRLRGLQPGRYRFRLRQVDFDGNFDHSHQVEVVISNIRKTELKIWPNPSSGLISLEISGSSLDHNIPEVIILDQLGRKAAHITNLETVYPGKFETQVDLRALSLEPGLYFVNVLDGRTRITQKIVLR